MALRGGDQQRAGISGSASSGTIRSRARVWTASAPTSVPITASADVGEQQDAAAARAAPGRGRARAAGARTPGTATTSTTTRKPNSDERLGDEHRRAVDRGEQERVEAALLALGDEQPVDAEHRGEQQRHPQHAGGEVAVERVAVEPEVEEHERRDAEQRHRRDDLERAQLGAQVLADSSAPTAARLTRYSSRIVGGVDLGGGREQPGAPAAQAEHEVGLGEARLDVVAR